MELVMKMTINAILFAAVAICTSSYGQENELKFASGLQVEHKRIKTQEHLSANLMRQSNGKWGIRVLPSLQSNMKKGLARLRDREVDVAMIMPGYHPTELPHTNLVVDLSMLGQNSMVLSAAVSEYMFSCVECLAESEAQGSIFMAMTTSAPLMLLTSNPITTPESLRSKKIRGHEVFSRWINSVGAIRVSVPVDRISSALTDGELDANLHRITDLNNLDLRKAPWYVTKLALGTYNGYQFNIATEAWRSMTAENRRLLLNLFAESIALTTVNVQTVENSLMSEKVSINGVKIIEPSPELIANVKSFSAKDNDKIAEIAQTKHSIADATQRISRLQELTAKWRRLLSRIDSTDFHAVAQLYKEHIWEKVDPSIHGMRR